METSLNSAGVFEITLTNTAKRNAFNLSVIKKLGEVFLAAESNAAIKCVLIKSASAEVFTAGLDLGLLQAIATSPNKLERIQELQAEFLKIYNFSKPVLVAVSGFCVGAGVDLICLCDLRYACETARFSAKEIAFGIAPDLGTIPRMAMLAPEGWTLEKLLTGSRFCE